MNLFYFQAYLEGRRGQNITTVYQVQLLIILNDPLKD